MVSNFEDEYKEVKNMMTDAMTSNSTNILDELMDVEKYLNHCSNKLNMIDMKQAEWNCNSDGTNGNKICVWIRKIGRCLADFCSFC